MSLWAESSSAWDCQDLWHISSWSSYLCGPAKVLQEAARKRCQLLLMLVSLPKGHSASPELAGKYIGYLSLILQSCCKTNWGCLLIQGFSRSVPSAIAALSHSWKTEEALYMPQRTAQRHKLLSSFNDFICSKECVWLYWERIEGKCLVSMADHGKLPRHNFDSRRLPQDLCALWGDPAIQQLTEKDWLKDFDREQICYKRTKQSWWRWWEEMNGQKLPWTWWMHLKQPQNWRPRLSWSIAQKVVLLELSCMQGGWVSTGNECFLRLKSKVQQALKQRTIVTTIAFVPGSLKASRISMTKIWDSTTPSWYSTENPYLARASLLTQSLSMLPQFKAIAGWSYLHKNGAIRVWTILCISKLHLQNYMMLRRTACLSQS